MGRSKRWYCLILLVLLPTSAYADGDMPGVLDSLVKFAKMDIRASGDADSLWEYHINKAIQEVCNDFPAYPRLDTAVFREDSGGVALNTDLAWIHFAQKIDSTLIWLPMGQVGGDTTFMAVIDVSQGKTEPAREEQPRLWYVHGSLFTQPKFVDDTFSIKIQVHYFATDQWITDGTDTTNVLPKYRSAIIDYACYSMLRSLSDPKMVEYKESYNRRGPRRVIQ